MASQPKPSNLEAVIQLFSDGIETIHADFYAKWAKAVCSNSVYFQILGEYKQ